MSGRGRWGRMKVIPIAPSITSLLQRSNRATLHSSLAVRAVFVIRAACDPPMTAVGPWKPSTSRTCVTRSHRLRSALAKDSSLLFRVVSAIGEPGRSLQPANCLHMRYGGRHALFGLRRCFGRGRGGPGWRNGRRKGLKIPRGLPRVGSSPTLGIGTPGSGRKRQRRPSVGSHRYIGACGSQFATVRQRASPSFPVATHLQVLELGSHCAWLRGRGFPGHVQAGVFRLPGSSWFAPVPPEEHRPVGPGRGGK